MLPGAAGPASGASQRITPGLVVQFGQPRLAQPQNGGVRDHRGLLEDPELGPSARRYEPPPTVGVTRR
ncbi:MAG TPA: hypothetical protein VG123_15765, partial [Streptosporangiaceae bacterium]|nr:hypothetical protein [Streptosporangiaceae bacterium]